MVSADLGYIKSKILRSSHLPTKALPMNWAQPNPKFLNNELLIELSLAKILDLHPGKPEIDAK